MLYYLIFVLQYLFPILILGAAYFFCIFLPIQNQKHAHSFLISTLKIGDRIITKSGIIGVVMYKLEKNIVINSFDQTLIEIEIDSVCKKS